MSTRTNVVCQTCVAQGETEISFFAQHWNASDPIAILTVFQSIASYSNDTKSVFWPDRTGQIWLHHPVVLEGSKTTSISTYNAAVDANVCAHVVHLYNLFKHRIHIDPRAHQYRILNWI